MNKLYAEVLDYFARAMPVAEPELNFNNKFELIVAVVLSAQCTDKRVNMVTPALFAAFPTAESMAAASEADVLELIKSVSYPNSKAAHLVGLSRMLCSEFGGKVPATMDELLRLPGVGRKTANVVLAVGFGEGRIAVDTHVFRVAERLGLVHNSKTPLETERQLTQHIPVELRGKAHHWLLLHGRYVCVSRKPKCEICGLNNLCSWSGKP